MYSVSDETRKPIFEGVQGENEAREIQFDISSWIEELGEGVCTATAKRPTDTIPYPVTVTRSGNVVTWKPNSTDTSIEGIGAFQLAFSINNVVAKTRIWNTKIAPSLDPAGDPPDPYDNWLAEMREIEASAIQAAQDADGSADDAAASAASIAGDHDELINIRIGADGTTYPSAGDAVRGQVSDVKDDLNIIATIEKPIDLMDYPYEDGYLTTGGVFVPDTPATQKTTDPIYLNEGDYTVDFAGVYNGSPNNYVRAIAVYNASDVCTHYYNTATLKNFTVLDSDSYVRINSNAQTITEYSLYLTSTGGETVAYINDGIVKTDKTLTLADVPADSKSVGDKFNDIVISQDGIILDETYADWQNGYINVSDGSFVPTTNTQHTTDFIELAQGIYYGFVCDFVINNARTYSPRAIVIYNEDQTLSRSISPKSLTEFKLSGTEKYVRININFDTLNSMQLFDASYGENGKREYLDDGIAIPKRIDNYIHARRPLIAFILDGDYNRNSAMEAVFDSHNFRAGFAIPYTETFTTNSITTYFNWEKKGHEILSHSRYAVGLNGSATDEEIAEIVEESYRTLKGYGFDIHGFVAYQGSTKPVTVTNVKKFFDYGCDATNHSASQESCMFFGNDSPYMLWRYSMQLSTLQEMKDAVDRCLANNGLLIFYGHANSDSLGNFTAENLEALLTYIETVGGVVKKPYEAIADYYSIRYDDIASLV